MPDSIVLNIDCMEGMKAYPDRYFDLAVVDPPYRDKNTPTKDMRKKGGKMDDFGKKPGAEYFKEIFRISQQQIIWGANNFLEHLYSTNCFIFWDKEMPLDNFSDGELAWTSFSKVAKKFYFPIYKHNQIDKIHPTEKPVALYSWIYKNYLPNGGKVIDTHLGSGSNRIAADKAGNIDFVGFELDKDYYEAQEKRWKNYKAQMKLFV